MSSRSKLAISSSSDSGAGQLGRRRLVQAGLELEIRQAAGLDFAAWSPGSARARSRCAARARCPASGGTAASAAPRARCVRIVLVHRDAEAAAGNGPPAAARPRPARAAAAAGTAPRSAGETGPPGTGPARMASTMSRLVAAISRTLTRSSWVPPTRVKVPSSRNRSSLACSGRLMSAISSRKIVPPSASSTRPGFCFERAGERALSRGRTARFPAASREWRRS